MRRSGAGAVVAAPNQGRGGRSLRGVDLGRQDVGGIRFPHPVEDPSHHGFRLVNQIIEPNFEQSIAPGTDLAPLHLDQGKRRVEPPGSPWHALQRGKHLPRVADQSDHPCTRKVAENLGKRSAVARSLVAEPHLAVAPRLLAHERQHHLPGVGAPKRTGQRGQQRPRIKAEPPKGERPNIEWRKPIRTESTKENHRSTGRTRTPS